MKIKWAMTLIVSLYIYKSNEDQIISQVLTWGQGGVGGVGGVNGWWGPAHKWK